MRYTVRFSLALVATLAVLGLGGVAVVYGGADDSPGLQGIGAGLVVGATAAALRWQGGGTAIRRPESPARCGCGR